jgi:hypothetical protein
MRIEVSELAGADALGGAGFTGAAGFTGVAAFAGMTGFPGATAADLVCEQPVRSIMTSSAAAR